MDSARSSSGVSVPLGRSTDSAPLGGWARAEETIIIENKSASEAVRRDCIRVSRSLE